MSGVIMAMTITRPIGSSLIKRTKFYRPKLVANRHQMELFSAALDHHRSNKPNPPRIEFLLDHIRFQRREFLGLQHPRESAKWNLRRRPNRQHCRSIRGDISRKFLLVFITFPGMGLHDDAG